MDQNRRSVLAALGLALPFSVSSAGKVLASGGAPALQFRSFEEAVRTALAAGSAFCRVEVGHSEAVQAGLQGCCNDRPFAGFPAGRLRIVGTASGPEAAVGGVRLYVTTVDVALGDGTGRPFDFASLPAAPVLA